MYCIIETRGLIPPGILDEIKITHVDCNIPRYLIKDKISKFKNLSDIKIRSAFGIIGPISK